MGPAFTGKRPALRDSFLDWGRVKITPQAMFQETHETPDGKVYTTAPPKVLDGNHYAAARETDSAMVEVTDSRKLKHYEKFLFYRGIGNFKLPLQFAALGEGRFEVTNFGPEPVTSLFLVHIEGGRVRYSRSAMLAAHGVMYLQESAAESTVEALADDMVQALTEAGLYEKECRAMVKTWRSSWFGEEGTRLLYFVPPRLTDEVLPLIVSPRPDETVRVLVGRMEVLTPERGKKLTNIVRELGTCFSPDAEPLHSELKALGRFAEPALEHLLQGEIPSECRPQLTALLEEARQGR